MKIALLSDIHGNSVALDAVFEDIKSQGDVDAYWILGDLVAIGPDPVGVLQRLINLPNTQFIRGNSDRYIAFGDRPPPTRAEVESDSSLMEQFVEITESFSWTHGALAATGWLKWLKDLPLEITERLPDGTKFLGVHASPGEDNGLGFSPDDTDGEMRKLLHGCEADLICVGHTHRPMTRKIDAWHVVNLGSVSMSPTEDKRASYVLLNASSEGNEIRHRLVYYNIDAVFEMLEELSHPGRQHIIKFLTSKNNI